MPFELMLIPRAPRARFQDEGPLGAKLLHEALSRLQSALGGLPPLNMWVRTAPSGAGEFCWHLDVLPRLAQLAGLEMGTGVSLNIVPPEQAAAALRDAS
jgi:UDPglucose--hexose-1-phosphate uridylyltransferase